MFYSMATNNSATRYLMQSQWEKSVKNRCEEGFLLEKHAFACHFNRNTPVFYPLWCHPHYSDISPFFFVD